MENSNCVKHYIVKKYQDLFFIDGGYMINFHKYEEIPLAYKGQEFFAVAAVPDVEVRRFKKAVNSALTSQQVTNLVFAKDSMSYKIKIIPTVFHSDNQQVADRCVIVVES